MPFILSPNFSNLFHKKKMIKKERMHGDGITYDVDSPEAFDEVFFNTGDDFTTNMCFGGENDQEAFITLSRSGKLVKMKWHCKGWRCHYENLLNPKEIIGTGSDTNRNSNL